MANTQTFHCSIVTPERVVLECDAHSAVFTAHDGEMGFLLDRAPHLAKLGIGAVRVDTPSEQHTLFIDGGFVQVVANRLTILTEQAAKPEDIDVAAAKTALTEAQAIVSTDDTSYIARDNAIQRAKAQINLGTA